MAGAAIIGSALLGHSQAKKQRKAEKAAQDANERMFERQLEELNLGRAEAEPILQMMIQSSRDKFKQMTSNQAESQALQKMYMSGSQRAAQQQMSDANQMAMSQATSAGMGTGRYGSVLAAQMGAGLAQQAARGNQQLAANYGVQMAGMESQQQSNRLGLAQAGLASEQFGSNSLVNMINVHRGGTSAAMGNMQYMAPSAKPNIFGTMMGAAGAAGGFGNLFNMNPTKF